MTHSLALALAAALLDVTLGYPASLARAIGTPALWLGAWLRIVRGAAEGPLALALYLAPVGVGAAALAQALPEGPLGFAATALLGSIFMGRQTFDASAKALALSLETEGPGAAMAAAEALDAEDGPPGKMGAAALAARFADGVAAPTLFLLLGGLAGVALCTALVIAGRDRRADPFSRAVSALERWTLTPAARLGAFWIALAAAPSRGLAAFPAILAPTAPAQAAMLAALGDAPDDVRRALALYRRAAAVELAALSVLALASALVG